MHRDDESSPPRPRWLKWVLLLCMVLVVLGMLNLGWRILQPGVGASGTTQNVLGVSGTGSASGAISTPSASAVFSLVDAAACLRCHGMERRYVGPSFQQIATRYRERADAVDYLARKIRNGGVGEWGRTLMPRQPQVTEAQAREIAQWLVSLPVSAPLAVDPGAPAAGAKSSSR